MKKFDLKKLIRESIIEVMKEAHGVHEKQNEVIAQKVKEGFVAIAREQNDIIVLKNKAGEVVKVDRDGGITDKDGKPIAPMDNATSKIAVPTDDTLAEVAPPNFPKNLYNKIKGQYPGQDDKAYATMWKIHNMKESGDARVAKIYETFNVKSLADLQHYLKGGQPDELTNAIANFQKGQYDQFFDVVHALPPAEIQDAFLRLYRDYERKKKGVGDKLLHTILLRLEGPEYKAERDAIEHILKGAVKNVSKVTEGK
jgi:hypothetical protein